MCDTYLYTRALNPAYMLPSQHAACVALCIDLCRVLLAWIQGGGVSSLLPDLLMTLRLEGRGPGMRQCPQPLWPHNPSGGGEGSQWVTVAAAAWWWLLCNKVGQISVSSAALFPCLDFRLQAPGWWYPNRTPWKRRTYAFGMSGHVLLHWNPDVYMGNPKICHKNR